MSLKPCVPSTFSNGFTLIEVIAALVIFSGGVLMVIQISGSLSDRMEWAALASEVSVVAQARLDSLEALPFDSIPDGWEFGPVTVHRQEYYLVHQTSTVTPLLKQVYVWMVPMYDVYGPTYNTITYVADAW